MYNTTVGADTSVMNTDYDQQLSPMRDQTVGEGGSKTGGDELSIVVRIDLLELSKMSICVFIFFPNKRLFLNFSYEIREKLITIGKDRF